MSIANDVFHQRWRDNSRGWKFEGDLPILDAKEGRVFRQPGGHREFGAHRASYGTLAGFVGLCFLVAASGGAATAPNIRSWYALLHHPIGTPPDGIFGPVWAVLYLMIAVAGWRVWLQPDHSGALRLWVLQLAANAAWPPIFFGLHRPGFALGIIVAMDMLVIQTIRRFSRTDRVAAAMLVPYLAWGFYATYLNAGFWWLNR